MKQQITKNAIEASFISLLNEKPFEKITVRDIVEDCELTRNTFYYYFQDIYEIVEDILRNGIAKAVESIENRDSWEGVFVSFMRFAHDNRMLVRNLVRSPKADELQIYFDRALKQLIDRYISNITTAPGFGIVAG